MECTDYSVAGGSANDVRAALKGTTKDSNETWRLALHTGCREQDRGPA